MTSASPPVSCLLASDLDGTLIPGGGEEREGLPELEAFREAIRNHSRLELAYVTGRHLDLAVDGIRRFRLPAPGFLVCDVGTTLYENQSGRWVATPAYAGEMRKRMGGRGGEEVLAALTDEPLLALQEPARQAEFKKSYTAPLDADRENLLQRVRARLRRAGLRARPVYSVDRDQQTALLDVLPEAVAKDFALRFLWKKLDLSPEQVVYAGDSGNDLAAFLCGCRAILVGNTPKAVREEALAEAPHPERLYLARGPCAAGVVEGCRHFGVFRPPSEGD